MRRFLAILGLLAIFMAAPTASAQGFLLLVKSNSYVLISENSAYEKVTLEYVVSQNPENVLDDNFRVHGILSNVNVYDTEGGLSFSVENVENEWSLIRYALRDTLRAGDRSDVTVEFTKAVENISGNLVYGIRHKWRIPPTSYQILVKLPQGSSLINTSENTSDIHTENDSIYMRYSGVQKNSFQTYIVFSSPPSDTVQPPEEEEPETVEGQPPFPYVVILVAIALAIPLTIFVIKKIRPIKPPRKALEKVPKPMPKPDIEKILRMLHENERKVVEALIQEDNLTQSELCGRTGIPKSTISRILAGLEYKGLVKRIEHGMSKKVMLSSWVKGGKRESYPESET